MRTVEEVQRAHDLTHAIATHEVDIGLPPHLVAKYHLAHDVLSWVLNGPCGHPFAEILLETVVELERHGFTPLRKG